MRTLWMLLLLGLATVAWADDEMAPEEVKEQLTKLVGELKGADATRSHLAEHRLAQWGEKARPTVQALIDSKPGGALEARAKRLLVRIGRQPRVLALRMTLELPKTIAAADVAGTQVVVRIANGAKEDALLSPFWELTIGRWDGGKLVRVKTTRNMGRWGRVRYACFPRNLSWLTVPAGKSAERKGGLLSWGWNPGSIRTYAPLAPGKYRVTLVHDFSHARCVARCRGGACEATHTDPKQPWCQALELRRQLVRDVEVTR